MYGVPDQPKLNHQLWDAALRNDLTAVEKLVKSGANVNVTGGTMSNAESALYVAITHGNVNMVNFLLQNRANPNIDSNNPHIHTPLQYALDHNYVEIAMSLLQYNADPNISDKNGNSPLHYAAYNGQVEMVNLLLEKGVDPNVCNPTGSTPLHYVVANRVLNIDAQEAVFRALLGGGARAMLANNSGNTPVDLAPTELDRRLREPPPFGIEEDEDEEETIEAEDGPDLNAALRSAVAENNRKEVKALIKEGAKVNAQDEDDYTPLHFAIENRDTEMIKLLIKYKANPDIESKQGTPREIAREFGVEEVMQPPSIAARQAQKIKKRLKKVKNFFAGGTKQEGEDVISAALDSPPLPLAHSLRSENVVSASETSLKEFKAFLKNDTNGEFLKRIGVYKPEDGKAYKKQDNGSSLEIKMKNGDNTCGRAYVRDNGRGGLIFSMRPKSGGNKEDNEKQMISKICEMAMMGAGPNAVFNLDNTPPDKQKEVRKQLEAARDKYYPDPPKPEITGGIATHDELFQVEKPKKRTPAGSKGGKS